MANIDGRDLAKLNNVPDDTNAVLGTKVDKVTGKSLISDTEITRLAGVTNQTLSGIGGEAVANKKTTLTDSDTDYPTTKVLTAVKTEVDGRIDDLGTMVIRHEAEIASLENTINSANINQETTATVTGVDTVSLPKTAANTGMQVQLFGQSAENLVVNGDFRNGTTGWTSISSSLGSLNGILSITGTGTAPTPRTGRDSVFVPGQKYYLKSRFRVTNSVCSFMLAYSVDGVETRLNSPVQNQWYELSNVGNAASDFLVLGHWYFSAADANGKVMEVDYVYAINLTATFGAGNEPTKEQCDILFANYFEGSDNVLGTGRVKSVGKNLFDFYGLKPEYNIPAYTTTAYKIGDLFVPTAVIGVGYGKGFKLNVLKNTNYVVSFSSVIESCRVNIFGVDTNSILANSIGVNAGLSGSIAFNSGENNFIIIGGQKSTASITNGSGITSIQLERASTATTYEPYKESYLYLTTTELRSNGLIKDEIRKGTNGYELVKQVGVGTLGANRITGGDFETGLTSPSLLTSGASFAWNSGTKDATFISAGSSPSQLFLTSQNVGGIDTGDVWVVEFYAKSSNSTGVPVVGTPPSVVKSAIVEPQLSTSYQRYVYSYKFTAVDHIRVLYKAMSAGEEITIDNLSIKKLNESSSALRPAITFFGSNVHYTLATPIITPITHAGLLNSNSSGTVYFEPIIADAGVYSSNLAIQLTDYPISSFESIRKYANGTYTELSLTTGLTIAHDGLSFEHDDLEPGDLVMFTYAYANESIGRSMVLTYAISSSNPYYNITNSVPLTTGYYTSTTARAAVPEGIRKTGLILTYETAAGVWYTERYIGTSTDTTSWTTAGNWEIGVLRIAAVTDTTEYEEITI